MASLKEISRKIKSVKNTQKTTRAMKLVSTAKLRRTEQLAKNSQSYADKINDVLSDIAYKINKYQDGGLDNKFFNVIENPKVIDIVFITADKGLCGGFNLQTIKSVNRLLAEYKKKNIKVRLRAIGRKGIDYFNFKEIELLDSKIGLSSSPDYTKAADAIEEAIEDFTNGATDGVILIHNGFKNMLTQEIRMRNLLPVQIDTEDVVDSDSMIEIEPEEDESVLNQLVQKYIEFNVYYALIDSLAAEHSARMQAMDAATTNAKERANELTLEYNKARQEAITTELIEIISGVESLK
jgi:F-type H+-transporting ATPase subunit gamma